MAYSALFLNYQLYGFLNKQSKPTTYQTNIFMVTLLICGHASKKKKDNTSFHVGSSSHSRNTNFLNCICSDSHLQNEDPGS